MELTECSETSAYKIKTAGNVQKKEYNITPFVLYMSISSSEGHSSSLIDINLFFLRRNLISMHGNNIQFKKESHKLKNTNYVIVSYK